jgi:hypothetical protein
MNSKSTEINHPKECQDDPCRLIQVINIRIWLDFYEDDMSPWVQSSIRIQRPEASPHHFASRLQPTLELVSVRWGVQMDSNPRLLCNNQVRNNCSSAALVVL